jgi:two-component system sensor histidine kinase DesK
MFVRLRPYWWTYYGWFVPVLVTVVFGLVLFPPWTDALAQVAPGLPSVATLVSIGYGLLCLIGSMMAGARTAWRASLCLTLLAGLVLVGLCGPAHAWMLVGALCIIALLMPIAVTLVVGAMVVSGPAAAALSVTEGAQFSNVVVLVSSMAAVAVTGRLVDANAELTAARDQIALFAVARERERVARELHDIFGHSLTTITLKAGLARRVLETGDHGRAVVEIHDVERLGRQALTDVRATLSEYGEVTLAGELAGGERGSGGGRDPGRPAAGRGRRGTGVAAVFGDVLREAITNVVRHSAAERATVRLGQRWISVSDDGVGADAPTGNGLDGLRERMRAVGGEVDADVVGTADSPFWHGFPRCRRAAVRRRVVPSDPGACRR